MFFCHECDRSVSAARSEQTEEFECAECHGTFVEQQEAAPPAPPMTEEGGGALAGAAVSPAPDAVSALVGRMLAQYLAPGAQAGGRPAGEAGVLAQVLQQAARGGGIQLLGGSLLPVPVPGAGAGAGAGLASDPRNYASGDGDYAAMLEALLQRSAASRLAQPASAAALAALPSRTLEAAAVAGSEPCAICTDGLAGGDDVKVLPCGHVFHEGCVVPWLTQHSSFCPVCRASVEVASRAGQESEGATAS